MTDISNLPIPRNPHFTGRDATLTELSERFNSDDQSTWIQVIKGMGGVGKTQTALEFAYRYASAYQVIWWLNAADESILASDYAAFAVAADLPEKAAGREAIMAAVRQWLETHPGWLFIFDGVKQPQAVIDYLPRQAAGQILLTSRHQVWEKRFGALQLDAWPRAEAVSFLLRRTNLSSTPEADGVSETLKDLPLALEHAGAWIAASGSDFAGYLKLFDTNHCQLWENRNPPLNYPDTVGTTCSLSVERVHAKSAMGVLVLNLCAFFASHDIPLELIGAASAHVSTEWSSAFADKAVLDDGIDALNRYALVNRRPEGLSIHRLVQAAVQDRLSAAERNLWSNVALRALNTIFVVDGARPVSPQAGSTLLAHARVAIAHADKHAVAQDATADLLDKIGVYLHQCNLLALAQSFFERAISRYETQLGDHHPDLAAVINNLAALHRDWQNDAEAEQLWQRSLQILEAQLGADHPDAAIVLNNLAVLRHGQGKPGEAAPLLRRALEIQESRLGSDHLSVAGSLSNLGAVLHDQGEYIEAERLLRRALAIQENRLDGDHLSIIPNLSSLGTLLHDQGKYAQAQTLLRRALTIQENQLGGDHPDTAAAANRLASVLLDQGKLTDAETLLRRALTIQENRLGDGHPDTAVSVSNLAEVLHEQGLYSESEPLYRRAIAIHECRLGDTHPQVATGLNNLAAMLHEKGDLSGAEPLYRRALEIYESHFGSDHPAVATSLNNLAALFAEQDHPAEAEPLYQRALAIRHAQLGDDHPDVAASLATLAALLRKQGDQKTADALLHRIPVYYLQDCEPDPDRSG
jgi:tetratricopeptide (TPR) repeat protein